MASNDNVLRTKILREINEQFHQGDKLNAALDSECLYELVRCFDEEDKVIRELASRAIIKVATTEKGRMILIEEEIIPKVRDLFNDEVVQIRANAYKTLINVAEFTFGIDSIINFNIVPVLIDKLVQEENQTILILILELLKILNEGELAPMVIQGSDALSRLNKHLKSTDFQIRELAALNLGSISYNSIGKEQTIDAGSIPPLCQMLTDKISQVRTAATRALVSLSQYKEGKVQIYDLDKLNEIIALLKDSSEQTRLNIVQLICNLGEYPPAKDKFKECLKTLDNLVKDEKEHHPLVSRFAQQAIDIIDWKP
jgi:hypothetical protein